MSGSCEISQITVERYATPFGVQHPRPRLSWRFAGDAEDWIQASYDIRLKRSSGPIEECHVEAEASVFVTWPFESLISRERVNISIRATSTKGVSTDWANVDVEAALLNPDDWSAEVTLGPDPKPGAKRPFLLRRLFTAAQTEHARLYVSALGMYKVHINNMVVGDHVLAPGWQSYRYRLHYQTFDVSSLLKVGENEITVWIGEGWYAGRLGWEGGRRNIWGEEIGLLAQLELDRKPCLATGSDGWMWSYGQLIRSELYDGECIDFRDNVMEWLPGRTVPRPSARLVASEAPPVRRKHEIKAVEIINTPSGQIIIDFGQNLVGWVRIEEPPPSRSTVIIRHAEVLDQGELGIRPLRVCKATDTLLIDDGEKAIGWEPKFTFHGFRYVQVEGWEGVTLNSLTAIVVYTDMERIGDFKCSHHGMTKFHENTVWGLRGNFVSVPTDCPQRDERLGWTGDLQVFCPTANFLYNSLGMLGHWLEDLAWEQLVEHDGVPPQVVPNVLPNKPKPFAIWADAAILTPHDLYKSFGDIRLLQDQWKSMRGWLERGVRRSSKGLWDPTVQQLGDWLDPAAPEDAPDASHSDPILVANAYLLESTRVFACVASVIGQPREAEKYRKEYQRLRSAFQDEYMSSNGRVVSDTQATFALALRFDLVPPSAIPNAADRLNYLVRRNAFKIGTGFAGTPAILPALASTGHVQTAYRMFQNQQCPSLLYPISMGATTPWERWNSMLVDGSINPGEMTSFNHYALGSASTFLYETVGGLAPAEPGWKKAIIKPVPGGTVKSAQTTHISPYGRFACRWAITSDSILEVDVEVPPNTTARIEIPHREVEEVGSGKRKYTVQWVADPHWPVKVLQPPPMRPQLIDEIVE